MISWQLGDRARASWRVLRENCPGLIWSLLSSAVSWVSHGNWLTTSSIVPDCNLTLDIFKIIFDLPFDHVSTFKIAVPTPINEVPLLMTRSILQSNESYIWHNDNLKFFLLDNSCTFQLFYILLFLTRKISLDENLRSSSKVLIHSNNNKDPAKQNTNRWGQITHNHH